MLFGSFINALPPVVFELIHLSAFLIGALFAYRAFGAESLCKDDFESIEQ